MHINERGIEIVKRFEGLALRFYVCDGGVVSVGHGATRGWDGRPFNMDMEPITEAEAEAFLVRDLESAEGWVRRLIKTSLSENSFSALVSFTFNVGAGALQRSILRMKLNRGEYQGASDEFPKWKFANKRILAGLVRRRAAERSLFLA
ncbi:lysozyme [Rhodospirillales bacterium]|nr:lysozyme [Rhodospirillales bacterium]